MTHDKDGKNDDEYDTVSAASSSISLRDDNSVSLDEQSNENAITSVDKIESTAISVSDNADTITNVKASANADETTNVTASADTMEKRVLNETRRKVGGTTVDIESAALITCVEQKGVKVDVNAQQTMVCDEDCVRKIPHTSRKRQFASSISLGKIETFMGASEAGNNGQWEKGLELVDGYINGGFDGSQLWQNALKLIELMNDDRSWTDAYL